MKNPDDIFVSDFEIDEEFIQMLLSPLDPPKEIQSFNIPFVQDSNILPIPSIIQSPNLLPNQVEQPRRVQKKPVVRGKRRATPNKDEIYLDADVAKSFRASMEKAYSYKGTDNEERIVLYLSAIKECTAVYSPQNIMEVLRQKETALSSQDKNSSLNSFLYGLCIRTLPIFKRSKRFYIPQKSASTIPIYQELLKMAAAVLVLQEKKITEIDYEAIKGVIEKIANPLPPTEMSSSALSEEIDEIEVDNSSELECEVTEFLKEKNHTEQEADSLPLLQSDFSFDQVRQNLIGKGLFHEYDPPEPLGELPPHHLSPLVVQSSRVQKRRLEGGEEPLKKKKKEEEPVLGNEIESCSETEQVEEEFAWDTEVCIEKKSRPISPGLSGKLRYAQPEPLDELPPHHLSSNQFLVQFSDMLRRSQKRTKKEEEGKRRDFCIFSKENKEFLLAIQKAYKENNKKAIKAAIAVAIRLYGPEKIVAAVQEAYDPKFLDTLRETTFLKIAQGNKTRVLPRGDGQTVAEELLKGLGCLLALKGRNPKTISKEGILKKLESEVSKFNKQKNHLEGREESTLANEIEPFFEPDEMEEDDIARAPDSCIEKKSRPMSPGLPETRYTPPNFLSNQLRGPGVFRKIAYQEINEPLNNNGEILLDSPLAKLFREAIEKAYIFKGGEEEKITLYLNAIKEGIAVLRPEKILEFLWLRKNTLTKQRFMTKLTGTLAVFREKKTVRIPDKRAAIIPLYQELFIAAAVYFLLQNKEKTEVNYEDIEGVIKDVLKLLQSQPQQDKGNEKTNPSLKLTSLTNGFGGIFSPLPIKTAMSSTAKTTLNERSVQQESESVLNRFRKSNLDSL